MEVIAWLGVSHGIFAAILMMTKRNRSVSDQILTAWLCLLAIEFLSGAVDIKVYGKPLLSSAFLLFNPAFYIYVRSLTDETFKLKYIHLLHLLPFVSCKIVAYIIQEPYTLKHFFESDSTLWFRFSFSIMSVISWIAYNTASALKVVKHRNELKNEFSTLESDMKLGWLLFVVVIYNVYCGVAIILGVISVLKNLIINVTPAYIFSAMLFFVYVFSFYGLIQKSVFIKGSDVDKEAKYKRSLLTKRQKEIIRNKILEHFKLNRPYLDPEFNMSMLSESLNIPKYQLTEVLNVEIGKNFFQFVNDYRIEEAKKQLANKNNLYSIEAIGYESGFNSKSSFFTVFKKTTGYTPNEYKEISK